MPVLNEGQRETISGWQENAARCHREGNQGGARLWSQMVVRSLCGEATVGENGRYVDSRLGEFLKGSIPLRPVMQIHMD